MTTGYSRFIEELLTPVCTKCGVTRCGSRAATGRAIALSKRVVEAIGGAVHALPRSRGWRLPGGTRGAAHQQSRQSAKVTSGLSVA